MPRNVTINITGKSIALALAAFLAIWLLVSFDKILLILFLATLLAVAIDPLVNRLEVQHIPRALGIVIVYLLLIIILSSVLGLLTPVMIDEWSQLSQNFPKLLQQVLDLPTKWITPYFPSAAHSLSATNISSSLSGEVSSIATNIGGFLVGLGKTLTTLFISIFLILVVGFFLTSDAGFAPRLIARFFPPTMRPTISTLADEIGGRLGHWVRAQILVGLFFGITFGLGLAIAGVPYALSLGAVGAVLELIPYLGGAIVTVIGMIVALSVSPWLVLFVLGWEIVVANIESHIVYPKLVGDIVGLHPLTIIIALFIGAELKGVIGALLAVPVAIVVQVLFDYFYRFEDTPAVEEELEPAVDAARLAHSHQHGGSHA